LIKLSAVQGVVLDEAQIFTETDWISVWPLAPAVRRAGPKTFETLAAGSASAVQCLDDGWLGSSHGPTRGDGDFVLLQRM